MVDAFQVLCIARAQTNWGHRHIVGVGTASKPGSPDRWPVAAVIARIEGGDLFYTVGELGDPVFVRRFRCWCGTESVRTTTDVDDPDPLDALPACDWEGDIGPPVPPPFSLARYRPVGTRSPPAVPAPASSGPA